MAETSRALDFLYGIKASLKSLVRKTHNKHVEHNMSLLHNSLFLQEKKCFFPTRLIGGQSIKQFISLRFLIHTVVCCALYYDNI